MPCAASARLSASAYKHSTAHVLHALGLIASPEAHPACRDLRGPEEATRMDEALRRVRRMAEKLEIPGFPTEREMDLLFRPAR